MALHISPYEYTHQSNALSLQTQDHTTVYYAPHCHMSFLDRRDGNSGRPLAWRSGLPPSKSMTVFFGHKELAADGSTAILRTFADDGILDAEELRYEMQDFLQALVWANHDMLRTRRSQLEPHIRRATYVKENDQQQLPPWLAATAGEHLHIHSDGSAHMVLSLTDAATAVECGWADASPAHPLGYVETHAPRNREELVEWKKLVLASARYCTYAWTGSEIRQPERL